MHKVHLAICAILISGCAYVQDRASDAADIFDAGVTASKTADFSAYLNGFSLLPVGYSNFHGAFAGLADGRAGGSSAVHRANGAIFYGIEQIAYLRDDEQSSQFTPEWRTGIIGLMNSPRPPDRLLFSLPVQVHVVWFGATFNFKAAELLDFIVGFATIDILDDDEHTRRRRDERHLLEPPPPQPPLERYEPRP